MRLALPLALALALPAIAAAQPSDSPPGDPADPQAEPADPPPAGAPPEPVAEPPQPGQPLVDLQRAYDDAFNALLAGNMATAIAGFDRVAASASGDLAASARELSRLARELSQRGVRFVVAPSVGGPTAAATPSTGGSVTKVSEDDERNSGRIGFVAWSTFAGIYTGITLLDILDVDDFRGGTLLILGTTGAGFAGSLLATADRDVSAGMADAYSTGILLGAGNGLLLASPLGLDSSEEVLGVGLASMAIGGVTGLVVADRSRPTVGQTSFVSTMSFLGIATTGLGLAILGDQGLDGDTVLTLLAGGLDAGAVAGILIAPRLEWSKGRGRLVQLGSLLGGLAGLGIAAIITGDPEDDAEARLLAASTLGGLWAGFGLTTRLTRDMPPDPRYRDRGRSQTTMTLAPTMIGDGPGLVAGGSF